MKRPSFAAEDSGNSPSRMSPAAAAAAAADLSGDDSGGVSTPEETPGASDANGSEFLLSPFV